VEGSGVARDVLLVVSLRHRLAFLLLGKVRSQLRLVNVGAGAVEVEEPSQRVPPSQSWVIRMVLLQHLLVLLHLPVDAEAVAVLESARRCFRRVRSLRPQLSLPHRHLEAYMLLLQALLHTSRFQRH
jgi:hypothetical protein